MTLLDPVAVSFLVFLIASLIFTIVFSVVVARRRVVCDKKAAQLQEQGLLTATAERRKTALRKFEGVTRVEMVDGSGLAYSSRSVVNVALDIQDGGWTLKLFVNSDQEWVDGIPS